jgi:hypothetical protein
MSTSLHSNRRDFFQRATPLLVLPMQLDAQDADPIPAPLTTSVLSATETSAKRLDAEVRARRITSRSVRRFQTSLGILFDHLDETGHSAHMLRALKAKGLMDSPLDYQQLSLLRDKYVAKTGNTVSANEFQALVQSNETMWPKLHALRKHGGDHALRMKIMQGLENGANRIEQDERSGHASLNRAHLKLAQLAEPDWTADPNSIGGWDLCAALNLTGLYFATWAYMDAMAFISVAAFSAGPAMAVVGLMLAGAAFLCM